MGRGTKLQANKKNLELNQDLMQSMLHTIQIIDIARRNYEFAEEELIDYYLYEIKANQSKLNYLIKKFKKNGIALDRIQKIEMMYLNENQVV